jgi:hypothetical protein
MFNKTSANKRTIVHLSVATHGAISDKIACANSNLPYLLSSTRLECNKHKDLYATGLFSSLSDDFGQMMRGFFCIFVRLFYLFTLFTFKLQYELGTLFSFFSKIINVS